MQNLMKQVSIVMKLKHTIRYLFKFLINKINFGDINKVVAQHLKI